VDVVLGFNYLNLVINTKKTHSLTIFSPQIITVPMLIDLSNCLLISLYDFYISVNSIVYV